MSSQIRLFVSNLPENTNENDLQSAFSSFGNIITLDLKCKSADENNKKNFAFVTLSASNYDVESCIKHFTTANFNGSQLYVTRARESFLERLQRERDQAQKPVVEKTPHKNPVIKLGDKLNPRKRKADLQPNDINGNSHTNYKNVHSKDIHDPPLGDGINNVSQPNKKKEDSDKKRMESLKRKRQEFKEKQNIIKTGLTEIDNVRNRKIKFSDNEEDSSPQQQGSKDITTTRKVKAVDKKNTLFDEDDSGDEVNFEIKKQFEGKKGQKVLDLQSRYKSDKRFVLDERFVEEDQSDTEKHEENGIEEDTIDIGQPDEKAKQFNILQDILGVSIKTRNETINNQKKSKLGMLRFDPSHPEHAKFLAPVEKVEPKSKKKKSKQKQEEKTQIEITTQEEPKVEVSKEQFYTVSETLKEAIAQPTTFSLRSLFAKSQDDPEKDEIEQDEGYIPLETPKGPKMKNSLEPREKNPFVYDSSDSEAEDKDEHLQKASLPEKIEVKAVWRENLFFTESDHRLTEGLAFFNKTSEHEGQKERRELKSLMKKRIYNKERKTQMFQKKIGGKRKNMNKSYKRNS